MKTFTLLTAIGLFAIPTVAFAAPASPDNGCHGFYTNAAKVAANDQGVQGSAIGGNGNSDGNPDNGQAHSDAGRGAILQDFLANMCDVGSQSH